MEKYFDNLTLGQFLLTGLKPIKVYVDGQYLILTDTDDIEDPLYGQGMTISGRMVHFDYRLIDHILVGDKPVTLDMLGAEEEEEAEEAGEEEEEAADEETEEEVEEEGHIRLGSLLPEAEKAIVITADSDEAENLSKKGIPVKLVDKMEEDCGCGGEAGEPGIDTISEPYMYKIGDMVHNTNPSCKHYGSKGIVLRVHNDDLADTLVKYMVTNNGGSYEQGDILDKTADQLEPM